MDKRKKQIVLLGIAGTDKDFLLSLPVLASYARRDPVVAQGCEIHLLHYEYLAPGTGRKRLGEVVADILGRAPEVVGFSVYVWNVELVFKLAAALKAERPGVKIILGGPEMASREVRAGRYNREAVDYIVCGDGEKIFRDLLRSLFGPGETAILAKDLFVREGEGFFPADARNYPSAEVEALDSLPSPYLTGAVTGELLARPGMRANFETQRGCNMRCAYCLYHKNSAGVRYRDPDVVVAEIAYAYKKGVREFRIIDANFFSSKRHAAAILRGLIARKIEMAFFAEAIPSFVSSELTALLAGYIALSPRNRITVGIGLQSINPKSLQSIKRRIGIESFDWAFKHLAEVGAIIKTDIILALPYETKESYCRLLEYVVEKMRYGYNYLSFSILRVLPGTDMESFLDEGVLTLEAGSSEHLVYETADLPRADFVDCLRMNTVVFRFFSTLDYANRLALRDRYFQVKDTLGLAHVELLRRLLGFFREYLGPGNSNFAAADFPGAEQYCSQGIFHDLSDDVLLAHLDALLLEP